MASKPKIASEERKQVELGSLMMDFIDRLGAVLGFKTRRETVENAITLLAWAARELQQGRSLVSLNKVDNTFLEYILPYRSFLESCCEQVCPTTPTKTTSPSVKKLTKKGTLEPKISDLNRVLKDLEKHSGKKAPPNKLQTETLRRILNITKYLIVFLGIFLLLKGFRIAGFDLSDNLLVKITAIAFAPIAFLIRFASK